MTASEHELPERWTDALLVAFGVSTSGVILALEELGMRPLDLLLFGASLGALLTAGLWLWLLALRRSTSWAVVFTAAALVPYVNFVVASVYARRYWTEGARRPALLAIAAILVETIVSVRVFASGVTPPV